MEEINEKEFDKLVTYTLRIELKDGRVILYCIDTDNKNYLINRLRENSDGNYDKKNLDFLWFKISANRMVLINVDSFVRITFCFDYNVGSVSPNAYYDNFDQMETETLPEEQETKEGEVQLHVIEEDSLPQVIIFHKGSAPSDHYDDNPLTYYELNEGCLEGFEMELEGNTPFRQFISLIDNDGEDSFIPIKQIIIMELDSNLVFPDNGDKTETDTNK